MKSVAEVTVATREPAAGSALRILGIEKSFGPSAKRLAVIAPLNLEIRAGEFVSMVGPSGCGKSTLLQAIAGLIEPSGGRVLLGERDVTGEPAHMVYLFQQYSKSLLPWLTVEENVAFAFRHRVKLDRAAAHERCQEYLEMVGIGDFSAYYPWQLSGGMQQRLAIARALAAEPQVFLMDEPFSSVDALTRLELHALILQLWERKRFTALLVTHDVDEAIFLADRVVMLTNRPMRIAETVETNLPRPRNLVATNESSRFLELRHHLLRHLLARPGSPDAVG